MPEFDRTTCSGCSITFVLICIFVGTPTEMAAQEPLASGSRVRVTAPECELRGQAATFRALRADTLVLGTAECPLASVTRLDVSGGQKSHALLGAGIGFAAGALVGLVHCSGDAGGFSDAGTCDLADDDLTLWVAFVSGAIGGLAGGIVGKWIKTDRWEEVPLEQLRVSPQPDGGFALGFSVRF